MSVVKAERFCAGTGQCGPAAAPEGRHGSSALPGLGDGMGSRAGKSRLEPGAAGGFPWSGQAGSSDTACAGAAGRNCRVGNPLTPEPPISQQHEKAPASKSLILCILLTKRDKFFNSLELLCSCSLKNYVNKK